MKDVEKKFHTLEQELQYTKTQPTYPDIDDMAMEQENERLINLKDEDYTKLVEGWNAIQQK